MFNNLMTGTNKVLYKSTFSVNSLEIGVSRKGFSTNNELIYGNYLKYNLYCKNISKLKVRLQGKKGVKGSIYLEVNNELSKIEDIYPIAIEGNYLEDYDYTTYYDLVDLLSKDLIYGKEGVHINLYYVYDDDTLISNGLIQGMYHGTYDSKWNTLGYLDLPQGFINSIQIPNTGDVQEYYNSYEWNWEEDYLEMNGIFDSLSGGQLKIKVYPMSLIKNIEQDYENSNGVTITYSVEVYNAITETYETVKDYDNITIGVGKNGGTSLSKTYTIYLDDVESDNPYSNILVSIHQLSHELRMKSSKQSGSHMMIKAV